VLPFHLTFCVLLLCCTVFIYACPLHSLLKLLLSLLLSSPNVVEDRQTIWEISALEFDVSGEMMLSEAGCGLQQYGLTQICMVHMSVVNNVTVLTVHKPLS